MTRWFFSIALLCVAATAAAQQDVVTVGSVTANGSVVDVPVSIRDVSGTPLGIDRPAGSKIQAFSIKVSYAPASAVSAITFSRSGITAGLTPTSEFAPSTPGAVSLLDTFQESTNPIPFVLNAPPPGNVVAHLLVTVSSSAPAGSTISLTLDPSLTQLTDDGGTAATKESASNGALALVDGAISIPQPTLQLTPFVQDITRGNTAFLRGIASATVASDTNVTLTSSDPLVASVPSSVVMAAGTRAIDIGVNGIAVGSATITATFPNNIGGASATARINIVANCAQPSAPQISGPAVSDIGIAYTITWPAVVGATDYAIDESTDANFISGITQVLTATSATYVHTTPNVRYYYRVRAHNGLTGCNVSSSSSVVISVLINPAPAMRILAVVGSAPGTFGSHFKTSVQLYNPQSAAVSGKIVFHSQETPGSASDPSLAYSLEPHKTISYADLLPAMGVASGVGSADIIADATSPLPLMLVRVFNDGGSAGTTGLTEDSLSVDAALQNGSSATLIAPDDVSRFRLNIGIRTLAQGVTLSITARDKDGAIVKSVTTAYLPTFFTQVGASQLLNGYVLRGGETITFDVTGGSAFIYGATTDNATNDPSVQFARPND